jgi:hypothetical protein
MKNTLILLILTLTGAVLPAQDHDNTVQREAMKKLAFLEGKWSGPANMMVYGQGNQVIDQTEIIEFRLGGTILVIEGLGKSTDGASKTVHHAFAVVSYDEVAQIYILARKRP